ncbi:hypothetical protein NKH70_34990 [Mesorhizobium sp. M0991]|uniref:hypothetical protein n=1 Tax=Mesorhizobium sp. M0991 TaxID=2957043 RepID=UPI00333A5DF6
MDHDHDIAWPSSWRDELLSALIDADILLVSPWLLPDIILDDALLDRASRLKAIGGTYDNRFSSFVRSTHSPSAELS